MAICQLPLRFVYLRKRNHSFSFLIPCLKGSYVVDELYVTRHIFSIFALFLILSKEHSSPSPHVSLYLSFPFTSLHLFWSPFLDNHRPLFHSWFSFSSTSLLPYLHSLSQRTFSSYLLLSCFLQFQIFFSLGKFKLHHYFQNDIYFQYQDMTCLKETMFGLKNDLVKDVYFSALITFKDF